MNNLFESRAWWFIVDNERGKRLTIRFGDQDFYMEKQSQMVISFKLSITEDILHRVPERKFILVGDSGQSDPEIYAELYCKHPNQILHICIRDVQGEGVDFDRFRRACKDIPETKWTVFREANELKRVRHQS